jgi:lipoate-protein ligase A
MPVPFRVIDTGVREGRSQIAFDEALVELHKLGRSPDTVRFLRFPPTVLIGRHQAISHEVKLDYCRANGFGLVRRITGGGAIYLDEGQVGWELVLSRKRLPMESLAAYSQAICEAVGTGLSKAFEINARFRPRNDIEVAGRKLCGTGGFFDGDTLVYQGTVLVDLDAARMLAALNIPAPPPGAAPQGPRVVTLKEILHETPDVHTVEQAVLTGLSAGLGIELRRGVPSSEEEALARKMFEAEIGQDAFVFGIDRPEAASVHWASLPAPGGKVGAYVRIEGEGAVRRIREIVIAGDFFITPPRIVYDLEAALRGVTVGQAGAAAEKFLAAAKPGLSTLSPEDVRTVIEAAVGSGPAG